MGKCLIFCAGVCNGLLEMPGQEDYLIAADAGLRHVRALNVCPNEILGDFDSLGYIPAKATVHPVEKDDTDALLAVRRGLQLGFQEFWFYGSLDGPRLDHTVANFQTLQFLADQNAYGYLIGTTQVVTLLHNGALRFSDGACGGISVFAFSQQASGVAIRGLKYELEDAVLNSGFPLGVSNQFTGNEAAISVRDGSLLVIWDKNVGIPERGEAL